MKKGYRIIPNGKYYRVEKFYSFLNGIFKITQTYSGSYSNYNYAEEVMAKVIEMEAAGKKQKKMRKKEKKGRGK